jgi:hypothetical protein
MSFYKGNLFDKAYLGCDQVPPLPRDAQSSNTHTPDKVSSGHTLQTRLLVIPYQFSRYSLPSQLDT